MGMEEPHAHMGESTESIPPSSFKLQSLPRYSASSPIQSFSVVLDRLDSVHSLVFAQKNVMSVRERHENGKMAWAWKNHMRIWGVNGVTFRFIAQFFALA